MRGERRWWDRIHGRSRHEVGRLRGPGVGRRCPRLRTRRAGRTARVGRRRRCRRSCQSASAWRTSVFTGFEERTGETPMRIVGGVGFSRGRSKRDSARSGRSRRSRKASATCRGLRQVVAAHPVADAERGAVARKPAQGSGERARSLRCRCRWRRGRSLPVGTQPRHWRSRR